MLFLSYIQKARSRSMKIDYLDTNNGVIIIGELSANHGNDVEIAKKTIKAIKEAGADVVKIQTYTPDTITLDEDNEYFQIKQGTLWDNRTLYDLYSEAFMPWEWTKELYDYAKEIGIPIFSSPFDFSAVDLLESLDSPAYKIASFEITDIPLIKYVASKGKPIIISTGIATEDEIACAVATCREVGNDDIMLLKCTSAYPAQVEDANLSTMVDFSANFGVDFGLSDHTMGALVPTVATALGAKIIEKHFILDRNVGGPDASFSMTPSEFSEMVQQVRLAEKSIGIVNYDLDEKTKKNRKFARSLFVTQDIAKGEVLTKENIRSVRPSDGLSPKYYADVIGKKALQTMKKGYPLVGEKIEGWKE